MPTKSALIIECSTPKASVARVDANGVVRQRAFTSDRNHNAQLFAPLQELLDSGPRDEIGLVMVGSGPGSYSGTRVGIAAAQGVALALGIPIVALPSILAVPCAEGGASCLAIGDARRGSYWTARIRGHALGHEPQLVDADGLQQAVAEAVAEGLAVFAFEDGERFPLPPALRQEIRTEFPDAARLWQAWQASDEATRSAWSSQLPQPIYLKPPHITPGKRPRLIQ